MLPFAGKIENQVHGCDFVCNADFLVSTPPDFIVPSTVPQFNWWTYEGNGTQVEKFFAIVDKNSKRSKWVTISGGTEFIPLTTSAGSEFVEKVIVWTKQMTELSQRNFRGFLLSLLGRLPNLWYFGMDTFGKPNNTLEDAWLYLPDSVTDIGVFHVPLTQSGITIIAGKMTHCIDRIDISYSFQTWRSVLSLLSEIIRRRQLLRLEIRLKDGIDDSVIFGKLLGVLEKFTGSLDIGFFNFALSKAHVEELLKVIGTTTVMKKVILESRMSVSYPIQKKLREECRKRNIEFLC